jgi:hypothetical protein
MDAARDRSVYEAEVQKVGSEWVLWVSFFIIIDFGGCFMM